MNSNSKSYKRAQELDKKGFAEHLVQQSNEFLISTSEDPDPSMGNALNIATETVTKAIDWAKGVTPKSEDKEFEYDIEEDHTINQSNSLTDNPVIEDPDILSDPILEKDKIQNAFAEIRNVFSPQTPQTFTLPINQSERIRFQEFLCWINLTSRLNYTATEIDNTNLSISKCTALRNHKTIL